MTLEKFSQNFWGPDFCNTAGFDCLVKRLKEGKQMTMDFEEYLEKRAKIERQYAEDLVRLGKTAAGKDEIGTLRRSWEQLKTETETTGRLHMQLSLRLQEDILKSVKEFRNNQKEVRKKSEDTVKRAQVHKRNCFEKNNRLRSTYEAKCRESDRAQEQMHKLETNPLTKAKDLQASHKKVEGAKAASNNADIQYQEAVKTLEEGRVLWEREMEYLCQKFQELEEQRIAFIRHQMWTLTNFCSQTYVDDDEANENIRKLLENCNVDEDIDLFIRERATGSERPAPIPYENFYNPRNTATIPGVPTLGSTPPRKELPPLPVEDEPLQPEADSTYSVPTLPMPQESHYSVPHGSDLVIAVYDYDAQGEQELSLKEGEIVTVIGKEDTVWWCGKLREKIGMFPAAYVENYSP